MSFSHNSRRADAFTREYILQSLRAGNFVLSALPFTYSLFGLEIHCNRPIPEISAVRVQNPIFPLPETSARRGKIVEINLETSPHDARLIETADEEPSYISDYKDSQGEPALRIWQIDGGDFLRLDYFDGTKFWLDRDGTQVWGTWPASLTIEDAATYLLGPVLGLMLRLRGVTCLHASAVSLGDNVMAFVGSEGAGKSTTAAALAQQGCAVVSDDVVALEDVAGSFRVYPAYPYLCLWPESVEAIYGAAGSLPRFSQNYEKRCLSLERQKLRFETRKLPLKAIYILGERRSDPAPIIQEIPAQKRLLALVANTFATNVLGPATRAKEFETLGRLLPCVRVREVFAHTDPLRLPELCRLIREDVWQTDDSRPALPRSLPQ